jgi:membrane fusion protein (multidrug efflux system)
LLVELDTSREEAQLKGLLAATRLAELSLQRARELRLNQTNSPADLDAAEAAFAQAQASVDQVRVAITKKNIVAPFAGRLGITQVILGQYLRAGDSLVQLEALDPLYADFGLPQQAVAVTHPGLPVKLTVDAFGRRTFPGTIEAINPRISDDTRNLRLRAVIANADGALRPGMFGRIEVSLPENREVLVLPATAIVHNPYGDTVFVIENGTAKQKIVQTGAMRGDLIAITGGIQASEQVVVAGQLKLRNGMPVRIDNSVAPDANPAPTPPES